METLRNLTPVARKEHKCMWCRGIIEVGEKYERTTHIHDGTLYDWVNHFSCRSLADKLDMWEYADEGVTDSDFYESVNDAYSDIMSNKFNEQWESRDFTMPDFLGKVEFLKQYYNIKNQ